LDKINEQKISKSFQYKYKSIVEEARIRGMKEFSTTLVKLYEIYISLKKKRVFVNKQMRFMTQFVT